MTISPERLRELIARADLSAKDRPQDRPTIAELESILNDTRDPPRPIEITPEGQIRFLARLDFADTAAALRELEQARTTLEGVAKGTHVIVPKEPTVAMLSAGALKAVEQPSVSDVRLAREASREVLKGDVMSGMDRVASADEITGILATMPQYYRAMLSAAPEKEPAQEKQT